MSKKAGPFAGMSDEELANFSKLQKQNMAASQSTYGFKALPKNGPFLTPRALAAVLCVSIKTLERMRKNGNGPPFIQFATKQIRYPVVGVDAWIRKNEQGSPPD